MKIRIKQCAKGLWYENLAGTTFPVVGECAGGYVVKEGFPLSKVIRYDDAELIADEPPGEDVKTTRAEELVEAHWKYVEALLRIHGATDMEQIEFHYKSAGIHFYKHGREDALQGDL